MKNVWIPGKNGYWCLDRNKISINEGGVRGICLSLNWKEGHNLFLYKMERRLEKVLQKGL